MELGTYPFTHILQVTYNKGKKHIFHTFYLVPMIANQFKFYELTFIDIQNVIILRLFLSIVWQSLSQKSWIHRQKTKSVAIKK